MKNYIKGKVRQLIFESETGYKVGIFRIKETNDINRIKFKFIIKKNVR